VPDSRPVFDHASNTDDRPLDIRLGNDTAVGNNCSIYLGPVNFAGWQESGVSVDRIEVVKEVVGWKCVGQSEVCFKKGSYRAYVFPVPLKDIGKDLVLLQRGRDDVLAEVVVII